MSMHLKPAFIMLFIWTLITGALYPAIVTGLAQSLFSGQANGSLISDAQGKTLGSKLIGQSFSNPKYFWGRPSATSPYPYNAGASSGSNLSQTNPALINAMQARIQVLKDADPANTSPIPVDLVTASGSGLDPHISPAAAAYQIHRVAKSRNLDPAQLREMVAAHTDSRQGFVLGEPRVNVLQLNLALDGLTKR